MTNVQTSQPARLWDDLEELSGYSVPDRPGWTRPVFSPEYARARIWLRGKFNDAGLETSVDPAGNLIGRLRGSDSKLPAIATGSHTDTVQGAGRFDGMAGVVGGLEAVRAIQESKVELRRDILLVDFLGEEANEFGVSCLGSRAVSGKFPSEYLDLTHPELGTMADALAAAGGAPERIMAAIWSKDDVAEYFEMHIEQGPILERERIDLAVVTAIAGIYRVVVDINGQPDHAGTTPMSMRRDALMGAAEFVLAAERAATDNDAVGTAGKIDVQPGSLNVVPGSVRLWLEFRCPQNDALADIERTMQRVATEIGKRRDLAFSLDWRSRALPVDCDPASQEAISHAITKRGYSQMPMYSGAGHDAMHVASVCPVGMIFVPSLDGRSHCPEEFTSADQIAIGVNVLADTLVSRAL